MAKRRGVSVTSVRHLSGTHRNGVTVVIPTYDREHLLGVTLRAVLQQRDVELEVVVVDDGSDRWTPPAGISDPRVNVVHQVARRGVAAARNAGIARAMMPWLAFTDDDDLWAPDKLARQLAALTAASEARWSCTGAVDVDDTLCVLGFSRPPPSGDVSDLLLVRNCIPGGASGVLASTALVRELGGFDEELSNSADYDFWLRLALAAPVATVDAPLLAYRVHSGGLSRQLDLIYVEIQRVRDKHAAVRTERGIVPAETVNLWIGDRHQRSGRRLAAARAFVRGAPSVGWANAASRAAEALILPGAYRWRDRRRAGAMPDAWARDVGSWLPDLGGPAMPSTAQPSSPITRHIQG